MNPGGLNAVKTTARSAPEPTHPAPHIRASQVTVPSLERETINRTSASVAPGRPPAGWSRALQHARARSPTVSRRARPRRGSLGNLNLYTTI
jgi:hypothetical protein